MWCPPSFTAVAWMDAIKGCWLTGTGTMRWARTHVIVNHTWIVSIDQTTDIVNFYWVTVVSQHECMNELNSFLNSVYTMSMTLFTILTTPVQYWHFYCLSTLGRFLYIFLITVGWILDHRRSIVFDCRLEGEWCVSNCGVLSSTMVWWMRRGERGGVGGAIALARRRKRRCILRKISAQPASSATRLAIRLTKARSRFVFQYT